MTSATIRSSASISTIPKRSWLNASGSSTCAEYRDTREDEALSAGCNGARRRVREPEVGGRPEIFDLSITAVSDAGIHHPTTIVA